MKLAVIPRRQAIALIGGVAAALALSACGSVKTTSSGGGGETYPQGNIQAQRWRVPRRFHRPHHPGARDRHGLGAGVAMPVVNKPGASQASTPRELAAATADGYKIAVQNASLFTITPLAVSAAEATSIDTFDVITGVSRDDYVMATNPKTGSRPSRTKKSGKTIR